jgi:hypothetical protein
LTDKHSRYMPIYINKPLVLEKTGERLLLGDATMGKIKKTLIIG